MKHKSGNRFSMQAQGDTAEILIYGDIGENFFGAGVGANQFAADLKALGDIKTLNVRLNSRGGDVFDGTAIYNQLAQHPATVNMFIDSLAASAASIIAMAGDVISIADNGMIMIHNAWAGTVGDAGEMRKMAEVLDKIDQTAALTYSKRSGQSTAKVAKMMTAETWMAGQEAVDQGFADKIMQPPAAQTPEAKARFDLSIFKNAPRKLRADMGNCECDCQECQAGDCAICTNVPCDVVSCDCPSRQNMRSKANIWTPPPDFYRARLKLYERR